MLTKAVLLLCLVAGAWAASANPKKLTREQEKLFLSALGMAGIREKIRARRDAGLRHHTGPRARKGREIEIPEFLREQYFQVITMCCLLAKFIS